MTDGKFSLTRKQEPMEWEVLPEDADERRSFERSVAIHGGNVRAAIANALRIFALVHTGGSFAAQCKIMANEVAKLDLAPVAQPAPSVPAEYVTDATHEKVMDAIAVALGDAYDCLRTWGAWSYGTMSQDDFVQVVEQPDRLAEIADAAIRAMLASGAQPALSVPGRATMIERLKAAVEGECDGLAIDDRHAEAILDYVLAAAPEAPKRKPLTREEMDAATRDAADKLLDCIYEHGTASEAVGPAVRAIGRAVEAAHGIKENSND